MNGCGWSRFISAFKPILVGLQPASLLSVQESFLAGSLCAVPRSEEAAGGFHGNCNGWHAENSCAQTAQTPNTLSQRDFTSALFFILCLQFCYWKLMAFHLALVLLLQASSCPASCYLVTIVPSTPLISFLPCLPPCCVSLTLTHSLKIPSSLLRQPAAPLKHPQIRFL